WSSSSSGPSASDTAAGPSHQNPTSVSPEPVKHSPRVQLFCGDGRPSVLYFKEQKAAVEPYKAPGFHPRTGEKLLPITREIATELKRIVDATPTVGAPCIGKTSGKPGIWKTDATNGQLGCWVTNLPSSQPRPGEPGGGYLPGAPKTSAECT